MMASIIAALIFMPKFREMKYTSVYEVYFLLFRIIFDRKKEITVLVFGSTFRSNSAIVCFIQLCADHGEDVLLHIYYNESSAFFTVGLHVYRTVWTSISTKSK